MAIELWTRAGAVWRRVQQLHVRAAFQWQRVDRAFVYRSASSSWAETYRRTPATPTSVSYSAPASVVAPSFTGEATWTVATGEEHLPVVVRFYMDGTLQSTQQNPGQPATFVFSIVADTGVDTWVYVTSKNGPTESAPIAADPINTVYQSPAVSYVSLTPDFFTNDILVQWGANNVPAGAYYGISFEDDYEHSFFEVSAGTSAGLNAVIPPSLHGYDLQEFIADGTDILFTVYVRMYSSTNALLAQNQQTIGLHVELLP